MKPLRSEDVACVLICRFYQRVISAQALGMLTLDWSPVFYLNFVLPREETLTEACR